MKLIERPLYLQRLKNLKGTPDIKIITGMRRSGKSRLLLSYIQFLEQEEPNSNIIYIDFTRLENERLQEYHLLNDYIESKRKDDCNNYLMIDEVQMCPNFEKVINSLHASERYDIYLTGSNAFLLSADLATLFTGRHIEINVYPFSFKEYCEYFSPITDIQDSFDRYTVEGGLAGSYVYKDMNDKADYIKEVFETIVAKDLVEKNRLSDAQTLMRIANYLMDNVGNITSPNSVSKSLTANNLQTNHVTVGRYLNFLCSAFVFYQVDRYDIQGKKYLESLSKYYIVDTGIRFAMLGRRNMDWGRIYENIVYLELSRRGYKVYVGKLYQKEIDFVATRRDEKYYIQVSDDISSEVTFSRECNPLLKIKDAYPKILIARTKHEEYDYQGIKIIDIASWLLS